MKTFELPIEQLLMYDICGGRKSCINPYIYDRYMEFDVHPYEYYNNSLNIDRNVSKKRVKTIKRSNKSFK